MGAEGHIWYKFLDRVITQPTWRNVFKKVVLDQTMAAPIYAITYIIGKIRFLAISVFFTMLFMIKVHLFWKEVHRLEN